MNSVHEVALSTQLAAVVSRAAQGKPVRVINLRIGALRQVVPSSMEYAWQFVRARHADPALREAELHIEWVPAQIQCPQGHVTQLSADQYLSLTCPECGEIAQVIAGEEFQVQEIEVETAIAGRAGGG
ncbi:hydrogenase maturation nickel metallochaperone HypA [Corynebacterium sp. 153RC1]|uniref:hydrogenase maturation nickel metallochaperone HypA n=1 Tax=unclassified Corynebacterium TaxID=2624378 RepID=UPI00211CDD1B|nr:hydrogenase maturation nickel metallochaperone HypA [Corynebacterium sp. 209RC1]MCQ9354823.1 hydrogenase maturation nickel metallochaperone HypA [Corynebacterium sp. 1222RC1]MCQ9357008.1 hydrogenase maturation nickel metallochaperone HypA [Corynebacterium sp. 122RC1]MCQ9359091.1 hydrogenase maturation nickel metallochaperone HypA [Corynebacterium sp. 142RC1]MCQ9361476.1 hydrogenase maturation nickel metallochaperone HypA [Corynebacterium sp. 153RC1]MCQ9363601.1 hydrogenase maturation nickel